MRFLGVGGWARPGSQQLKVPRWRVAGILGLVLACVWGVACGEKDAPSGDSAPPEFTLAELYEAGRFAEAAEILRRDLVEVERETGEDSLETAAQLNNLGIVSMAAGQMAEAETLLERSLRIYEAREGPEGLPVATTLSNLGELYLSMERFRRSIVAFERVLKIQEATLGPDSPDVGLTLERLAQAQLEVGEFEADRVEFPAPPSPE